VAGALAAEATINQKGKSIFIDGDGNQEKVDIVVLIKDRKITHKFLYEPATTLTRRNWPGH